MKIMEQNKDLFDIFNQSVFRIPDYQRGYAWGDKELSEFWDDLDEIPDSNREFRHYTGTLFLEDTEPMDVENWLPCKFYNIIDGQQRLTTIIILIFELLKETEKGYCEIRKDELFELFIAKKNLSETNEVYRFSYHDTNDNNKYLLRYIFENNKIVLNTVMQNHYTENLKNAKEYFKTKIRALNEEKKEILFKKITSSLRFDKRIIEHDLDVQAVFETMNNRGKKLTVMEKLKNRLIYLNEKFVTEESGKSMLRKKINDAWGKIYDSLAKNLHNPLDEDEFLSAHLSLYEKPQQGIIFSERAAEEKLFQMFCNKPERHEERPITYEKIENFIVSLSDLSPIWYDIHNSTDIIRKIILLNGSKEVKILLAALLVRNNREKLNNIFNLIERFFFRNNVPGMYLINIEYESAIKAREIYKNNELDEFVNYLKDKISIQINPQSVISNFRQLFSYVNGNKGFHRWGALKYFLFAYEEKLQIEYKEKNEKISVTEYSQKQIEHILPSAWQTNWNNEMNDYLVKINIDEEKKNYAIKVLINSLGNLTILDEKNQYLKNHSWSCKKDSFSTGSYNEIEISKYDQWNYISIRQRGEKMMEYLCNKIQDNFSFDKNVVRDILFDAEYIIKRIYEQDKD
jgi:uncharacterized protein with ParB-like and HNH nuclease domain